ncbi:serine O-acetyltransferase [Paraliobacillus ryukyuensis]|uniref:serine O-acetyltransferase n=1 Tax=Paraliobacillus ryukyuensis TaxID=200904 RepID=UPI0009A5B07C|nr:hypothetical protein [Paraliobacillus ryukyuensis]
MIRSKEDYKLYLEADRISLGLEGKRIPLICTEERHVIWKHQRLLRKLEYYTNCKKGFINKVYRRLLRHLYFRSQVKTAINIPVNVFGPGLSIAHIGPIIINSKAKVGANCRLHVSTNIGMDGREKEVATIGDNVYMSIGTKIIGNINIADGVVIGANSVVTRSVDEENITVAGAPAKKISSNGNSFPSNRKGYDIAKTKM